MISGHFSSFPSFMPILVLSGEVVRSFCALSGLIMSLSARTTNKTSPKLYYSFISQKMFTKLFRYLSDGKCYHMTLRLTSDWLLSNAYSDATQFNLIEAGANELLFSR